MSSAFQFVGGAAGARVAKLTTTSPTTIAAATNKRMAVVHLICTEIAGSTPNLTVGINTGSQIIYLRNAKAMAVRETVVFDQGYMLEKDWSLEVTASAANQVDVYALVIEPNITPAS